MPMTLLLLALVGCPFVSQREAEKMADPDGDGLDWKADCDNQSPSWGPEMWYLDSDGDGFGDAAVSMRSCDEVLGYVQRSDDCDDRRSDIWPGAEESCDGADNDCDGLADESGSTGESTFFADGDGDGYGDPAVSAQACTAPGGYVSDATDCDDGDGARYPTAAEVCGDGVDSDCDGTPGDCTVLWGRVGLDSARAVLSGAEGIQAGSHVAAGGDVNGDGLPDLLVSAMGLAYVIHGPLEGEAMLGDVAAAALSTSVTAAPILASAGDLDGDGFGDVAIGDPVTGLGGDTGFVVLAWGPIQDGAAARIDTLSAEVPDLPARVGSALGGGDPTGDGLGDLVVAAPAVEARGVTSAGSVYVLPGPSIVTSSLADASLRISGELQNSFLGFAVAADTDFSGDGLDDLVVSAPGLLYNRGGGYLFLGPVSGAPTLVDAAYSFRGEEPKDRAGTNMAVAGDVDGDGFADLLVGSDPKTRLTSSVAWLVRGPLTGAAEDLLEASLHLDSNEVGDLAGSSLSSAGDANVDGFADLLVGAPGSDPSGTDAGAVFLVLGPATGSYDLALSPAVMEGDLTGDGLGTVGAGGDLTGDGLPDLLVAAPGSDFTGNDGGAVYLFGAEAGF